MPYVVPAAKQFERPTNGIMHAVLADIVDLGIVETTFKGVAKKQPMVRFVWLTEQKGKDGKNLQVIKRYNASSMHEKANLYKDVKMILNGPPPVGFDIETLIGQTRQLIIVNEKSADGAKEFANIQGIAPAQPGVAVAIPADFKRASAAVAASNAGTAAPQPAGPTPAAQGATIAF